MNSSGFLEFISLFCLCSDPFGIPYGTCTARGQFLQTRIVHLSRQDHKFILQKSSSDLSIQHCLYLVHKNTPENAPIYISLMDVVKNAQTRYSQAVNKINSKPATNLTKGQREEFLKNRNQAMFDIIVYKELLRLCYEVMINMVLPQTLSIPL